MNLKSFLNLKGILTLLLILVAVFMVYGYVHNRDVSVGTAGTTLKVICQVRVDDDVFSDMDIESAVCEQSGRCFSIFELMSLNPLTVDGTVRLKGLDGSIYGKQDFSTYIGMGKTLQLEACVPSGVNNANVQLVNSEGGVEDSRGVTW